MPFRRSAGTGGIVFHVMNRGVRRARLFDRASDYLAFLSCLADAEPQVNVAIFAYCVMPNHFHLVVRPGGDADLSRFMQLATGVHSKRWHASRGTTGTGSVYQGRYKAFPVQADGHFLTVCRYVEANALRAGLVARAEEWPWGSLSQRCRNVNTLPLQPWPILQPGDWLERVNTETPRDLDRVRRSVVKGTPFGERCWSDEQVVQLDLVRTTRTAGRPVKSRRV